MNPTCPNCNNNNRVIKKVSGNFNVYFCKICHNGFTFPIPLDIGKYYIDQYWESPGLVGKAKDIIFTIFQKRRLDWLQNAIIRGVVLDVGSGEGIFGKHLAKNYKVLNLEPVDSKVKNASVIKSDLLDWKTETKFDAITFWESLEHTSQPQKYLDKAYRLLNNHGKIIIEFPRYDSFEAKLFKSYWFHLDLPRHLSHLTRKGLTTLLKRSGFKNVNMKSALSLEYAPWGLAASLLNIFKINATHDLKKNGNIFLLIILSPIVLISVIIEMILSLFGQSPISVVNAEKYE
jgi:SAM-dependent methyltransferase